MGGSIVASLLLAFVVSTESRQFEWNTLKVRYTLPLLLNGYYDVPVQMKPQGSGGWTNYGPVEDWPSATLFCYQKDPRLCALYDKFYKIAGMRVSYIKDDIKGNVKNEADFPYTYDDKKIFKSWNFLKKDMYYIDVLFINPEDLKNKGGMETRKEKLGGHLYINIDGSTWEEMPREESKMTTTVFTKQACFPGMGMHYFYNMTKDLECNNHQPPFLLYDQGELIGMGLVPFGAFKTSLFQRNWFESPPSAVIEKIVPNGPECLPKWIGLYGGLSIHMFFKKYPRCTCPLSLINGGKD